MPRINLYFSTLEEEEEVWKRVYLYIYAFENLDVNGR